MEVSNKGLNLIKKNEGFRNHVYKDVAGIPTIGYGNTYYINEDGSITKVTMNDSPITLKEGEELLKHIVKGYEDGVNRMVTSKINQNQFDALVSFVYNVGISAFENSTLLKRINNNPLDEDIKYQFSRWNKSKGKVLKGLTKRRNEETYLYFKPVEESERKENK
ncbi:lysozyme [Corallibacter sp.]|uniref:lysozyme n=1 Tax=Corallibacter sp. TaxID=2038084 RepID=UPI003AB146DE